MIDQINDRIQPSGEQATDQTPRQWPPSASRSAPSATAHTCRGGSRRRRGSAPAQVTIRTMRLGHAPRSCAHDTDQLASGTVQPQRVSAGAGHDTDQLASGSDSDQPRRGGGFSAGHARPAGGEGGERMEERASGANRGFRRKSRHVGGANRGSRQQSRIRRGGCGQSAGRSHPGAPALVTRHGGPPRVQGYGLSPSPSPSLSPRAQGYGLSPSPSPSPSLAPCTGLRTLSLSLSLSLSRPVHRATVCLPFPLPLSLSPRAQGYGLSASPSPSLSPRAQGYGAPRTARRSDGILYSDGRSLSLSLSLSPLSLSFSRHGDGTVRSGGIAYSRTQRRYRAGLSPRPVLDTLSSVPAPLMKTIKASPRARTAASGE